MPVSALDIVLDRLGTGKLLYSDKLWSRRLLSDRQSSTWRVSLLRISP